MRRIIINIIFYCCLLLLIAVKGVSAETADSAYFTRFYLNSTSLLNTSTNSMFQPPAPPFPSFGVVPQTSKIKTTISGQCIIGDIIQDPISDNYFNGFEFPTNSGAKYLWEGALWFGGIIGDDTLVSVGRSTEFFYDSANDIFSICRINELHPPNALTVNSSTNYYYRNEGNIFHSISIDTFTAGIPFINPWSWYGNYEQHTPMNIEVTMKSYVKNAPPYKNILLLDFIITNKNDQEIKDAYIGIYLDADVCSDCPNYGNPFEISDFTDDLAGSLPDIGTIYFIDSDGNLTAPECRDQNPTGTIALKHLRSFPAVTDTNFNWWTDSYNWSPLEYIDFGPRKKGTPENPFRDFGCRSIGSPTADSNKYYLLSNPEWDYDQYLTNSFPFQDTTWMLPDTLNAADIANGEDSKAVLSTGPFTIKPDSSIRSIFALFGSDLVHINPDNWENFQDSNYLAYYDNLFFDVLRDNAYYAESLIDEYLDPINAPVGLKVEYYDIDSAKILWDDYLFPEVFSYQVYIKEVPDSLILAKTFLQPDIQFDEIPGEAIIYTAEHNPLIITDLEPDKIYSCIISQISSKGESNPSEPILIGHNNPATKPKQVTPSIQFSPINEGYNKVVLNWDTENSSDILYYKIYRAKDSLGAAMRYPPFLYDNPDEIPFYYHQCYPMGSDSLCFYQRPPFDSTEGHLHQYIDSLTHEGYYYWITAVNEYRFESDFSSLIKAVIPPLVTKDIVVLLGSTESEQDYAYADSIIQYYYDLLDGYNFDLYNWSDSNLYSVDCTTNYCTDWKELAVYKLIIVEEYPSPKILTTQNESTYKLFTHLADIGNNIAYFGIPPGNSEISLSTYINEIYYDEHSFEEDYMGLRSVSLRPWFDNYDQFAANDTLAGFTKAIPQNFALPELRVKHFNTTLKPFFRQLFEVTDNLPFTAAIEPMGNSEILYNFESLYPESSDLHGLPVGVAHKNINNKVFTFGFHLWGIVDDDARKLIDYLYQSHSNHPAPYTVPNSVNLHQSYPNPFNGETNIPFSLHTTLPVSLDIYNILGQKIKSILNDEQLPAGNHNYKWDGTNAQNNEVASGIYFYRLQVSSTTMSKKMLLLK